MIGNSFVGDGVPDVPYWLAKNQDNFPMMDNYFVGDGVRDVPNWLAKNQDNFTDDLFSYLRHFPSP